MRDIAHKCVHDIIKTDIMAIHCVFQTELAEDKQSVSPLRVEVKFTFLINWKMETYAHAERFRKVEKESFPGFPYKFDTDWLATVEDLLRSIGYDKRQLCEPDSFRYLILKKCAELFAAKVHYH